MSLYNTLFGVNPIAPILTHMLGLELYPAPAPPPVLRRIDSNRNVHFNYEPVADGIKNAVTAWESYRKECIERMVVNDDQR